MESSSEEKDTQETNGPSPWLAVVLGVLVFLLWCVNFLVSFNHSYDARGTFGDMFGAVNALFTGLAFAAVIYAIFLQKHEVRLLKSELAGTKRMMQEQQNLAAVQLTYLRKQTFESTFFQYLSVFNQIVAEMDLVSKDKPSVTGKDVFPVFLDRIMRSQHLRLRGSYSGPNEGGRTEDAYEEFYDDHNSELGHYFRTLYNLFKFVHKSDEIDQRLYTNLIRAQLSDDEAMLLFLNGLSLRGQKFKPLLEKYSVLKNVDKESRLYELTEGKDTYSPSAFGE
ncbi:putative phage abortive infection protein [Pseudophaeobacter arcticus]|uniref:putative phage abortive infection protein n=1 Tax=Pseudophaeobacter arcticus TaxID=385492 RepID=UPI0012B588F6|nr:putative phage abortive infection protein [Pseudophaeobacter arcticus]